MHALHGATGGRILGATACGVGWLTTDGVVEDEDTRSSSSVRDGQSLLPYLGGEEHWRGCDLHVLEQLLHLLVVDILDVSIIDKVFLLSHMFVELESIFIQSEVVFISSDIVNHNLVRLKWSLVGLGSVYVGRVWWRAVFIRLEVVQLCLNVMPIV